MMTSNFEKITKRTHKDTESIKGRKLNKVRRDRSHKRIWEAK